jgi:putative ATP-dependent endonuclease of the OLD family
MKIHKITINNFRGIRALDWVLPDETVICLIGKGDSSKTTILDAIKFLFSSSWNLIFDATDFYNCDTSNSILIEATFSDFPKDFLNFNKYGMHIRGWDSILYKLHDEPINGCINVFTARLAIGEDLEPRWTIYSDRQKEGVDFKTNDRTKLATTFVGILNDRHFSWATGSALSKITEPYEIGSTLLNVSQTARNSIESSRCTDLQKFDDAAKRTQEIAKSLGVPVKNEYQANIDISSINIKVGGLALHDGNLPLRQLGTGSRRMLLCGIQKENIGSQHLTLIDELETGLEPHRISRLLKYIKDDTNGQYIITTHSPKVITELSAKNINIVQNILGTTSILSTHKAFVKNDFQGTIRGFAESLLSHSIILCEGQTEVGFIRGLDDFLVSCGKPSFSFKSITSATANGAGNIKKAAQLLHELKFQVCVLADADAQKQFSFEDAAYLERLGIKVFMWSDNLCLEQRIFADVSWETVKILIQIAKEHSNDVINNIESKTHHKLPNNLDDWIDSVELREHIGSAAKTSGWFKDINRGEIIFSTIKNDIELRKEKDLSKKTKQIIEWIDSK